MDDFGQARPASLRLPVTLIVRCAVPDEKLLEVMGEDVTQDQAFAHANDVVQNAVGGISDSIHVPGLVNVDFEDVRTVMREPGKAMMGTATATATAAATAAGPDRATKAADQAVACPLLEGTDGLPVLTQPAVVGSAPAAPSGCPGRRATTR